MYLKFISEPTDTFTHEWPLISSVYPVALLTVGYLYFIFVAGPKFMENRPPYKLRGFMLCYNIIEIVVNILFVREFLKAGWFSEFSPVSDWPSKPRSPHAMRMHNTVWWYLIIKFYDFIETCMFVLRKKKDQVTFLHIYHHISNVSFAWYYLGYTLDERLTFITMLNCAMHVVMYIYYFLTAYSKDSQKIIFPYKRFITSLQMVQFVVSILFLFQLITASKYPLQVSGMLILFITNIFILLILFYNFYKTRYLKTSNLKSD